MGTDPSLHCSVRRASSSLRLESLALHSRSLSSTVIRLCYEFWSNQFVSFSFVLRWRLGTMWLDLHSWWMTAALWNFTDAPSACGCFSSILTLLTLPLKKQMAQLGVVQLEWTFFFDWSPLYSFNCQFSLLWYFRHFIVSFSLSRESLSTGLYQAAVDCQFIYFFDCQALIAVFSFIIILVVFRI